MKDRRARSTSRRALRDLRKGDQITATFISKEPPVVVTETEVQATLAPGASPAAAAPAAAAAAPTQPAAAPPAAAPPASAEPAKPAPEQPQGGGTPWIWYLLIAVAIALLWYFLARKKEKKS